MGYRRFDMEGKPFEFSTCILSREEYAKVVSEINTCYDLYRNETYSIHYSVGIDNHYYLYYFENHGFNDYNIVEKYEF